MFTKFVKIVIFSFIPALLWGFGSDVVIDTMRVVNYEWPVSYDITWRDTTDMLVGIGFNQYTSSDTSAHVRFYHSYDRGNTWTRGEEVQWPSQKISKIQLFESPPYLIVFWQGMNNEVALTLHQRDNISAYVGSTLNAGDSVANASCFLIENGSQKILYLVIITRNSSYDGLKIYRSFNYGAFQQIYSYNFSNSSSYIVLDDVDGTLKGDSVYLYLSLENLTRSTNSSTVSYRVFVDDLQGNVSFSAFGFQIAYSSPLNLSTGVRGSYALSMFQADGDLNYVYLRDYFTQRGLYTFPHNNADSSEWGPFVKGWTLDSDSGFHIIFARGNLLEGSNLYYVKATLSEGTLHFDEPVLISDGIPVSLYNLVWFPRTSAYNPKLATLSEVYYPAVIWPFDFWHIFYAYPWYDSTLFVVDWIEPVKINENIKGESIVFNSHTSLGTLYLNFGYEAKEEMEGAIYNVEGKLVKAFHIPMGVREFRLELVGLGRGIYFLKLGTENVNYLRKFLVL
ncbi:MAG: hypothetical protein ACPLN0_03200 [Candidatus Hydrothermia bacterium]